MSFSYIDLFAGIGGFRLALDSLGGECVFSAEIDSHACKMYEANFGTNSYCDITKLDANTLPDFDMLCAGFPCQAFSISGKKQGFLEAEARGTLFFDVARILKEKNPKKSLKKKRKKKNQKKKKRRRRKKKKRRKMKKKKSKNN